MRVSIHQTTVAAIFLLLPCLALSRGSGEVEIRVAYDQLSQAVADHDIGRLMSFVAAQAGFIDEPSAQTDAGQFRNRVEAAFASTRQNRIDFSLNDIQVEDDKADVYLEQSYRYEIFHDKLQIRIPINAVGKFDETWHRRDGAWKLVRSRTLNRREEVDPQWQADYLAAHLEQNRELARFADRAAAALLPCNLSYNGCR